MNVKPNWIVYATMAVPVLWAFMNGGAVCDNTGWSPLILAGLVFIGAVYFHDNFIHKSAVEERKPINLGGKEQIEKSNEGEPQTLRYKNFPGR